jgi:hypothetical protein
MKVAYLIAGAGLYAVASYAWGGVGVFENSVAERSTQPVASAVHRSNKADRTVRAFGVEGAGVPEFSVEISNPLDAVITVRDRDGIILYRFSPTERLTIVAKRALQTLVISKPPQHSRVPQEIGTSSEAPRELADGCEGAFSPHAEPGMANVIGRCIS